MIRLGIIIVILVFVAVIARHINKKYVIPARHKRSLEQLDRVNQELDDQLERIRNRKKENTP